MTKTVAEYDIILKTVTENSQQSTKALKDISKVVDSLGKTVTKMTDGFTKGINRMNKSSRGAAQTFKSAGVLIEGVSIKQFKAVQQATRGFKSYEASVRRSGVAQEEADKLIKSASETLRRHNQVMNNAKTTVKGFTTSQETFRNRMQKSNTELRKQTTALRRQQAAASKSSNVFQSFTAKFDEFGRAVRVIEGPLGGTAARLQTIGAALKSVKISTLAAVGAFAALAFAVIKLVPAVIRARVEFERIRGGLKFATGDAREAADEFNFLKKTSLSLGLNLVKVGRQYTLLSAASAGTASEGINVRKVFETISKAAIVLGLSADDQAGIFRALQQMMSKGTVQAEELRGQLGERLPGAFTLAAKAMGVTTQELGNLLKQGKVLATDLIPKLVAELDKLVSPEVAEAQGRLASKFGRLSTAVDLFLDEVGNVTPILSATKFVIDTVTESLITMTEASISARKHFKALSEGVPILSLESTGLDLKIEVTKKQLSEVRAELKKVMDLGTQIAQREELFKDDLFVKLQTSIFGANTELKDLAKTVNFIQFEVKKLEESLNQLSKIKTGRESRTAGRGFVESGADFTQRQKEMTLLLKQTDKFIFQKSADAKIRDKIIQAEEKLKVITLENKSILKLTTEEVLKRRNSLLKIISDSTKQLSLSKELAKAEKDRLRALERIEVAVASAKEKIQQLGDILKLPKEESVIEKQIRSFTRSLEKAKVPLKEINALVNEYSTLLKKVDDAAVLSKQTKAALKLSEALMVAKRAAREVADASLESQLTGLSRKGRTTGDSRKDFIVGENQKALDAFRKSLNDKTISLDKLVDKLGQVEKAASDAFDRELMVQVLMDAQTPLEKYTERMSTLEGLMKKFPENAEAIKKAMGAARDELTKADPLLKRLSKTWENLADSISDSLISGENAIDGFKNVLRNFVNDALSDLIRLALGVNSSSNMFSGGSGGIGTILSAIGGFFGGFGSAAPVSPTLGAVSGTPFAQGGAWMNGARFLAKGGIVNSPTGFTSNEGLNVAGEAGPEAVLPLTRGSGGELGVNASGLGTIVIHQNLQVDAGVSQTVRAEMLRLLPQIKRETESAVIEARQRDPNIFGPNAG